MGPNKILTQQDWFICAEAHDSGKDNWKQERSGKLMSVYGIQDNL